MARPPALSVTAQGIAALLAEGISRDEFPTAEFPVVSTEALTGAGGPNSPRVPRVGVGVYPYRVGFNLTSRPSPQPHEDPAARERTPLLVDLHILICAWSPTMPEQLHLLALAARKLEDTPVLTASFLNRWSPRGIPVFEPNESVRLVRDALSNQDLATLWAVAPSRQQPALGYVAQAIAIDASAPLPKIPQIGARATRASAPAPAKPVKRGRHA